MNEVFYVEDGAGWSFKWDAHYVTSSIAEILKLPVNVGSSPWGRKNDIIIVGNRYILKDPRFEQMCKDNRVFLIWFHGGESMQNRVINELLSLVRSNTSKFERIIVPNSLTKSDLLEFGIEKSKIVQIPIGVDPNRFFPEGSFTTKLRRILKGIPLDAFCVGSFQKDGQGWGDGNEAKIEKGPDIFCEVMERLKEKIPKLHVVLTGPSRRYVKSRLEKKGISFNHWNLRDYNRIGKVYNLLDAYLIASRVEGGPKALMESWASGVPVVTTKVGMCVDWVIHKENGFLHSENDIDGMVDSLLRIASDDTLKTVVSQNALDKVDELSWKRVGEQYSDLIKKSFV